MEEDNQQIEAFKMAACYTTDTLSRCHQLSTFIKKRIALEEEYSNNLRKLCKGISLTPHLRQQPGGSGCFSWFKRGGAAGIRKGQPSMSFDASQSCLWSSFYEMIDDAAQVAKSHNAYSESLQHQLLEPLTATIIEMELKQNELVGHGRDLERDLKEATYSLKKAQKTHEKSTKQFNKHQDALENIQTLHGASGDIAKQSNKTKAAQDKYNHARETLAQQQHSVKVLQQKLYIQELPKIMIELEKEEIAKSKDIHCYLLGMIELERRCAILNESYANDMALKLKRIDLHKDQQKFNAHFMQSPPYNLIATTALANNHNETTPMHVGGASSPNNPLSTGDGSLSNPPSYESQQQVLYESGNPVYPMISGNATGSGILSNLYESSEDDLLKTSQSLYSISQNNLTAE